MSDEIDVCPACDSPEIRSRSQSDWEWHCRNCKGRFDEATTRAPEFRGEMVVWGYTAPYADKQEFGTPPFTPPLEPLAEWGERKLGSRQAGIAVWEKIQERGIEPKGFARAGRERQKEKVQTTRLQDNLDGL